MKNNLILRKIASALSLDPSRVQNLLATAGVELSNEEVANLLDAGSKAAPLPDYVLILFLNGLIDSFRGKRDGAEPELVTKTAKISNNDILKKLRIALNFQEQDLRESLGLVTIEITKSDMAALFRKAGHAQYKPCNDELLMDFIEGFGKLFQQRLGAE